VTSSDSSSSSASTSTSRRRRPPKLKMHTGASGKPSGPSSRLGNGPGSRRALLRL
jgi:hypothetical protein